MGDVAGRAFDPWIEADRRGITVVEARLPRGWHGGYDHARRRILLAPGMSHREARSALAHELQHAAAGDIPSPFGLITIRQELRARRATALVLVDPDEYAIASTVRGGHVAGIAHELDVTTQVVRDWMALHVQVAS